MIDHPTGPGVTPYVLLRPNVSRRLKLDVERFLARADHAGKEDIMFKHLLLAVDGSPLAESAFRKAIALAREMDARVTAVRVCPNYHVLTYQVEMLTDTREEYVKAAAEEAVRYLNNLAREAGIAGVPCETSYQVNDHP